MPGQTLTEIRTLLAGAGLAPRHRFGQNFLVDLNLMRKVVGAAGLSPADVVLEVGCGTGSLTELLLAEGVRVVGVEVDRGLQDILRARLGAAPRFKLVAADALAGKRAINPQVISALDACPPEPGGSYKLAANLPYQIATPLLAELLIGPPVFERLVCTIQKEVGERLRAETGSAAYGPVSVLMKTVAEVEQLAELPPQAFWPRPQVDSVLVRIQSRRAPAELQGSVREFGRFVQQTFGQRRKTLRRALPVTTADLAERVCAAAGVSVAARPEAVGPADWLALYRAFGSLASS